MAKGGRTSKQVKQKSSSQSPQIQDQQSIEDLEQDQEQEQIDYYNEEISDRDEELLDRINQQIIATQQPLKLTWAAIHKLKQQQKDLNLKMEDQMRKIQDKYHELKVPIIQKIAKVASGQILEKQLYTSHQLTKNLSIAKNKPQPIPGFWKNSFQTVGFVQGPQDHKILDSCTSVQCKTTHEKQDKQTIKVTFKFNKNEVFNNKQLKIIVSRKGQQFTKQELTNIQFKGQVPIQRSAFAEMFDKQTTSEQLFKVCGDLQRAFDNAVFYYFNETIQSEDQEQENNLNNQQQSQSQHQPQKAMPGKKKAGKKQQKKQLQKPQCKNQ